MEKRLWERVFDDSYFIDYREGVGDFLKFYYWSSYF